MADKDRKGQADDNDDPDADAGEAEERAPTDEAKPGAKARAATRDEDDPAEGDDEGDEATPKGEAEDSDEAAKRVAEALGVDGGEEPAPEEAADDATDAAAAPNRAARRQEAALRRKKRAKPPAEAEEVLPKDKNARAKELLKRRREQAAEPTKSIDLLPGEMVDDALARSTSAIGKWIRTNFSIIQWVFLAGLVGGGGYLFYASRVEKKAAVSSEALSEGISADRGVVRTEDKRSDDEKAFDPTRVFKTSEARADAALAGYRKVIEQHPNTGAAILARLGEAGAYLEKRDYPRALESYSAVVASTLAGADPDVKGRALEGLGLAKEGKGDIDGALATFKELAAIDVRGLRELGMYQQGRLLLAKGDKDKAKELLKSAKDKLAAPSTDGKLMYLEQMVDEALRRIDPTLAPVKQQTLGGPKGGAMSPEEMDRIRRMIQDAAKKKPKDEH